jgi:fluoride exporter
MTALVWLGVGLAGAVGAFARFGLDTLVARRWPSFPAGTLAVNVSGAFALGLLVGASAGHDVLLVVGTGLVGGYTTFSTWMLETQRLAEAGRPTSAAVNLFGSLAVGLTAAGAGWALAAALT